MKHRYDILNRVSSVTDLPLEPLPGIPLVELAGENRVLIENHYGVTEYGCNEICIKVNYGKICVRGNKLELSRMTKHQLVITGCIDNISLIRRNK